MWTTSWGPVSYWHPHVVMGYYHLIVHCFEQHYPRLCAGEVKTPVVGSAGNKLSGFRGLPTLNLYLYYLEYSGNQ